MQPELLPRGVHEQGQPEHDPSLARSMPGLDKVKESPNPGPYKEWM